MCLISHKYTQFFETSITEIFIRIICKYIKKYQRQNKELYNSIREENSFFVKENLISYIPARVYNNIEDLTEEIIKHANCRSSTVTSSSKDNIRLHRHYETKCGWRFLCEITYFFALSIELGLT